MHATHIVDSAKIPNQTLIPSTRTSEVILWEWEQIYFHGNLNSGRVTKKFCVWISMRMAGWLKDPLCLYWVFPTIPSCCRAMSIGPCMLPSTTLCSILEVLFDLAGLSGNKGLHLKCLLEPSDEVNFITYHPKATHTMGRNMQSRSTMPRCNQDTTSFCVSC